VQDASGPTWDYVVVGSGPGGGTVAARLAERGFSVLMLEAGGDPALDASARLPEHYQVPAFHAFASENPAMSWDFFVEHYESPDRQAREARRTPNGVLYPRCSALGGCSAHNAMIFVRPDPEDWRGIERLTKDPSWSPVRMNSYFHKLERCEHRPVRRVLRWVGLDFTGHGWDGWLRTERAKPRQAFGDSDLVSLLLDTVHAALLGAPRFVGGLWRFLVGQADPNDVLQSKGTTHKIWYTPLTTSNHVRIGARERALAVADRPQTHLQIELHALATRVLFDDDNRAIGVEYLKGERLYRASPEANPESGEPRQAFARREVILAGGTFNTPQLLMLSGVGPRDALQAHGVPVRIDLPGVGRNLQDRYEAGVVNKVARDWECLAGAKFERGDPLYELWRTDRSGMYVSNGAAICVSARAQASKGPHDLFLMALLARFEGYFPGYSRLIADHHDYLTWTVLKAHTINRAGQVTLKSADPRDPPAVNFRYFEEGSDGAGQDLQAVVAGIRLARRLAEPLRRRGLILEEERPGSHLKTDEELADHVRANAWGHHASGSCAIGPLEAGGVVDGDFRVHGTKGLRVVDASVFPRIPGSFLASAVYMIAEKAADVIAADAGGSESLSSDQLGAR
jgi:choline dehydrogenase-like flavoprotein